MYLINRAIAVIKPKQPFLEWLNRMPNPPVELTLDELQTDCTTILIPEFDYWDDSQSFIEGISAQVFEMELDSWYHDPNLWPADRDYRMFQDWFNVEIHSMVLDSVDEDITVEDI